MSERSSLENEWKNAFEGAEMTPPASVWSNVRAEVATHQASQQSKKAAYWQYMAAASVVLLISVGVASFYYSQLTLKDYQASTLREQKLLHEIATLEEEKCKTEEAQLSLSENIAYSPTIGNVQTDEVLSSGIEEASGAENLKDLNTAKVDVLAMAEENKNTLDKKMEQGEEYNTPNAIARDEPAVYKSYIDHNDNEMLSTISDHETYESDGSKSAQTTFTIESLEPINEIGLLAERPDSDITPRGVPDMIEIIKMQHGSKQDFKGMWAGLSVGGGSFESNINRGAGEANAISSSLDDRFGLLEGESLTNAVENNQEAVESPAFSYAVSADFGKQIGRRTYIQGGVEYSKYSSGATSNLATNDGNNDEQAFLRYENSAALDKGAPTSTEPYELANNYQYLAVPFKFGYQLLNRKIGISLSSGVSTNFFLKNTLKDKSGDRSDVEVTNGESSPYKPLNFNGLFGAEISYQWSDYYQISLVPDYRFSLDGVTKSDAFFQSNPTAFFLGFRFKYILK